MKYLKCKFKFRIWAFQNTHLKCMGTDDITQTFNFFGLNLIERYTPGVMVSVSGTVGVTASIRGIWISTGRAKWMIQLGK